MSRFRFREIRLENYRCFGELTLRLEEDTTVLFAENGGGKTALLTALAMGLVVFQRSVPKTLRLDAHRGPRMRTLDERGGGASRSVRARSPGSQMWANWNPSRGRPQCIPRPDER